MKSSIVRVCLFASLVGLFAACGGNPACDKNESADPASKVGDCQVSSSKLLGDKASCTQNINQCSKTDQNQLVATLDCLSSLPVCSQATQLAWETQQAGCYMSLSSISLACKTAMFGSVLPGEDGGMDGSVPDAGRQPITDGGGALSFVAVADDNTFAFAWVPLQPTTDVAKWELNVFDNNPSHLEDGGVRLPELYVEPGNARVYQLEDAGPAVYRRFYLAGVTAAGLQAFGDVDAGMADSDAGALMCLSGLECTIEQVCDLGQCKTQTCSSSATCPPGYICNTGVTPSSCLRQTSDGGIIVVRPDAGASSSAPLLSSAVSVRTEPPGFHQVPIGGFVARRPAIVAIDSARQFVAMEQGGQPVGHFTVNRGKDFELDTTSATIIDTVGSRVKLAWNGENKVLYACYSVGRGVRVRRSIDYGRTWGASALTVEPVDDGGFSSSIQDCDLAAWKNGSVLMVTVDDGNVVVRTIADNLAQLGSPEVAFISADTDGGSNAFFSPLRPAIATLPSDSMVHIGLTVSRNLGASVDHDVVAVYRDGTTGGFTPPKFLNAAGSQMGNGFPQDAVAIAIDPRTKRGIAAYTSQESAGLGGYVTVYVSIWNATSKSWTTGSDLTAFVTDSTNTTSYLFPAKRQADLWDAFSPSLAVMRDGRLWLSMLAGKRDNVTELHQYLVGFDFEKVSPVAGKGWFLPPAVQMSSTVAVDPRAGGNYVPATNSALAADSQISVYGVFVEGVGPVNADDNRGIFVARP